MVWRVCKKTHASWFVCAEESEEIRKKEGEGRGGWLHSLVLFRSTVFENCSVPHKERRVWQKRHFGSYRVRIQWRTIWEITHGGQSGSRANISDWIEPYLAPTPTQFRQFKLEMIQGRVCVSARSRCVEEAEFNPWMSLEQTPGHTAVSLYHISFAVDLSLFISLL